MKSTGILVWISFLSLSALVDCGGNTASKETSKDDDSTANGGSPAANTDDIVASGGTTVASGGTTVASGGSSASCDITMTSTSTSLTSLTSRCPAVRECMKTQCESQTATCYGSPDADGKRAGGQCLAYTSCTEACNCDSTCIGNCSSQEDQTCRDCVATIADCVLTSCANEATQCANDLLGVLTGTGGAGGAGGAAGTAGAAGAGSTAQYTCADLQACCASLTDTAKSSCETYYTTVSKYGDSACSLARSALGC